jgi:hypothetical protein
VSANQVIVHGIPDTAFELVEVVRTKVPVVTGFGTLGAPLAMDFSMTDGPQASHNESYLHSWLLKLKLKLKLFTTCTVCAGLHQIPYAPVAVSGPSQLCHTWNLQVKARPLTTYIQPLQGCSGVLLPPGELCKMRRGRRAFKGVRRSSVLRRGGRSCGI